MNILFMCVANSARSQMAEGLAKKIFEDKAWIESAGSNPKTVNPHAVKVMSEAGLDISKYRSKSIDDLFPKFIVGLNYIITLCAEEVCPTMVVQKAKKIHWPLKDPVGQSGSEEEQLEKFRQTRNQIKEHLERFAKELGVIA